VLIHFFDKLQSSENELIIVKDGRIKDYFASRRKSLVLSDINFEQMKMPELKLVTIFLALASYIKFLHE
jgi:hypothetical protein